MQEYNSTTLLVRRGTHRQKRTSPPYHVLRSLVALGSKCIILYAIWKCYTNIRERCDDEHFETVAELFGKCSSGGNCVRYEYVHGRVTVGMPCDNHIPKLDRTPVNWTIFSFSFWWLIFARRRWSLLDKMKCGFLVMQIEKIYEENKIAFAIKKINDAFFLFGWKKPNGNMILRVVLWNLLLTNLD